MSVRVHTDVEGGSIQNTGHHRNNPIVLALRPDTHSSVKQWFSFATEFETAGTWQIIIEDADKSRYPHGWPRYSVHYSSGTEEWKTIPTTYEKGQLSWTVTVPGPQSIHWTYHPPYSWTRYTQWISSVPQKYVTSLGSSSLGRPIHLIRLGSNQPEHTIWITARQHPGETMSSFFIESLVQRLLDQQDPLSETLKKSCAFYVVPCVNPDGVCCHNLRTNAHGIDLNRQWHRPVLEKKTNPDCPEVFHIFRAMEKTGINLYFDIHGEEAIPLVVCAPHKHTRPHPAVPSWIDKREKELLDVFHVSCQALQIEEGYPDDQFDPEEYWGVATHSIRRSFHCPAVILEMPFLYNQNDPQKTPWSIHDSMTLGREWLEGIKSFLCL